MNTLATVISRAGDGWLYFFIGAYIAHNTDPTPTPALLAMTLAVCFSMGLALAIKPLVHRPRPEEEPSTRFLDIDRHSYPSGHTFVAAAFTVACGWYYPWALIGLAPFTLLTAWSRVHLRAHYWSDVLEAGIWGVITGWGALMLVRWLL